MKRRIATTTWFCAVALAVGLVGTAEARRSNPPPGRNGSTASGGATCGDCHGDATGPGSVEILGVPAAYASGIVYDLTVRVQDDDQFGAGFQLSAEDPSGKPIGSFMTVDATTQLNGGWINHTGTGVSTSTADWSALGNAAEFALRWQAPDADVGPVRFWVVGNAVDNNGAFTGDVVYLSDETIDAAPENVPTVSEWGLIVLTLLLVTAGTLVMHRPAAVCGKPTQ